MKRGRYKCSKHKRNRNWLHLLIFVFFLLFISGIAYSLSPGIMDVTGIVYIHPVASCSDSIFIPPTITPAALYISPLWHPNVLF